MVSLFFQKKCTSNIAAYFVLICTLFLTSCGGNGSGGVSSGGDSAGSGDGKVIVKGISHTIRFDVDGVTLDGVKVDPASNPQLKGQPNSSNGVSYVWNPPVDLWNVTVEGCSGANSSSGSVGINCRTVDIPPGGGNPGFPGMTVCDGTKIGVPNQDSPNMEDGGFGGQTSFGQIVFSRARESALNNPSLGLCHGGVKTLEPHFGKIYLTPYDSQIETHDLEKLTAGTAISIIFGNKGQVGAGNILIQLPPLPSQPSSHPAFEGDNGYLLIRYTVQDQSQ
jgi:hypothetical protein